MSATMILASICLAFVIVLTMVATAVAAYFLWHGALWWMDSKAAESGRIVRSPPSREAATSSARRRASFAPFGGQVAAHGPQVMPGFGPSSFMSGMPMNTFDHQMKQAQAQGVGLSWQSEAGEMFSSDCLGGLRSTVAISPIPSPQRSAPPARSTGANSSRLGSAPKVQMIDIQRGLAAQLAMKFAGNLHFHGDNIEAVADVCKLAPEDICYCFLCLEELGNSNGGADLSLKKWGTGTFAARIWTLALARFVTAAQKQRGAQDLSRVEELCEQWQYQSEHFARELKTCEAPFQRKHGRTLLEAFQQEEIRCTEVSRAMRVLLEHGAAAAPRSSRLSLDSKPAADGQAVPALKSLPPASLELRSARGNARCLPQLNDLPSPVNRHGKRRATDSSSVQTNRVCKRSRAVHS